MKRKLFVLRHGKSDWSTGKPDFERPLVERGRLGAQRMAAWMQSQGWVPEHVVSSSAERARTTAEAACKTMGLQTGALRLEDGAYAASVGELLAVLADSPKKARSVMLVGHNPGLESLVEYLADDRVPIPSDGKILPTAALAVLETDREWADLDQGCAKLESITRPAEVPERFPAPKSKGGPAVERPAYYYTQSAVIPYRLRDGTLEVLIIASRKGKHWVVPKGIKEPELSFTESAEKEALEEAGAKGVVGSEPLGSYKYKKWGGVCSVEVYPMEVRDMVEDEDWEERHRNRQWVSAEEARLLLRQPELRDMVATLARSLGH